MTRFYCDVLGCKVERARQDLGLIQLRAGQSLIDLVPIDGELGKKGGAAPGAEGPQHGSLLPARRAVRPARGDRAPHQARRRAGRDQAALRRGRHGPSIYISDPEGNIVELKGPPARSARELMSTVAGT